MEKIKSAYVNQIGAYTRVCGLVEGTQRIPTNHRMEYWQQANTEIPLAIKTSNVKDASYIYEALYVGRIPTHFGHFLLEGLPRLCEAASMGIPIVGYITDGFLPEGIKPTPRKEINWVIKSITDQKFYQIKKDKNFFVENLYVPRLPIVISQSCSEPRRMTPMIHKIVKAARKEYIPDFSIENLYLKRTGEIIEPDNSLTISDPISILAKQISTVSFAKKISGKTGSNTHISMFAQADCFTDWQQRGDFLQSDRNQLICDLIKTYNKKL